MALVLVLVNYSGLNGGVPSIYINFVNGDDASSDKLYSLALS